MAWVGDNLFFYAQSMVAGFCVSCPESSETVMTDMREIGPTYYFAPPRVYENLLTQVTIRMEDASPLKRWMFNYFMEHARKTGTRIVDGQPVSMIDRLGYWLGNFGVWPGEKCAGLRASSWRLLRARPSARSCLILSRAEYQHQSSCGSTEAYVMVCAAQWPGEAGHGGTPAPGGGGQNRRFWRGAVPWPGVFHSHWNRPTPPPKPRPTMAGC